MDDTVMPGHHVEAGCEGEINHPTLVPAHIGQVRVQIIINPTCAQSFCR